MRKYLALVGLLMPLILTAQISHADLVDKNKTAYVWFSKCVDERDLDCIESLGIVDANGVFVPGRPTGFSRPSLVTGSVENKSMGFLDYTWNHKNETWELPGLNTEYGNSYVITEFSLVTGVGRWYDPGSNTISQPGGTNSMRFALLAVPTIEGFSGNLWGIPLEDFAHECVTQNFVQKMTCQRTANFESDQKIRATLRFSWYRANQVQSNLRENEYIVEEIGNGATRVTVSGKPMERPYFVDSLSLNRNVYTREKADALTNHWEIQTSDAYDGFTPSECRDKGLPIATGNMYSQSLPGWDPKSEELSINVWAPHLNPSGEIYRGYYEGNFPLEYISCLWGVDSESISNRLSISLLNEEGENNNVVTTTINQTSTGIRLIASGFHYSKETIRFYRSSSAQGTGTSTQKASSIETPSTSSPNVANVPSSKDPRISKIVCLKGKLTKVVKGIKPKCPSGFKKK